MTTHHAVFWMDHNELQALALDPDGTSFHALAHVHAHDTHTHPKKYAGHRHPPDARFLIAVEHLLGLCDEVVLFGPSQAKDALLAHLDTSGSPLRARIVTHAALDRLTDRELAAHARKVLRAAEQMRGVHV